MSKTKSIICCWLFTLLLSGFSSGASAGSIKTLIVTGQNNHNWKRGCEWAATGKVKQAVPGDFPTAGKTSLRPDYKQ